MDFSEKLKKGLRAEKSRLVTDQLTAQALGSGGLEVFSTPSMIAFMEQTSRAAVDPLLPEGWSTVGTELNVKHLAATAVGMEVRCEAELLEVDGRRLNFSITAYDKAGKIGEGTHGRFIIENSRFMQKLGQR
ncbi:MAG: thioesterase family protein [Spirochaetes bacterium]|nr:thioesterase family protein [Spirochaetota bacterium]